MVLVWEVAGGLSSTTSVYWGCYGPLCWRGWSSMLVGWVAMAAAVGLPRGSHGDPTGLPRGSHGAPMGLSWDSLGSHMGLSWGSHGASMGLTWGSRRVDMGLSWGSWWADIGQLCGLYAPRCGLYGNAGMLAFLLGSPPSEPDSKVIHRGLVHIRPSYVSVRFR